MENRRKSLCRLRFLLLAVMLFTGILRCPVYAVQTSGSLTLKCHISADGRTIPLADDTYAVFKVADITFSGNDAVYQTTAEFKDFDCRWDALSEKERRETAKSLEAYTGEHPELAKRTAVTDEDGELTFASLDTGLYLVSRIRIDTANLACSMDPFLVDIPTESDGELGYDVTAVPKFGYQSIRIRPCNVTIYMGGNEGYDAVDGQQTTSLPKPMFVIETPEGVDPEDVTLLYHEDPGSTDDPEKLFEWTPVEIGVDEEGNTCYRLDRKDGTDVNFHVQYYVDGAEVLDDVFRPELEEELYKMYRTGIPLSEGEVLVAYMTREEGSVFYPVVRGTAELTVRGVERTSIVSNPDNPVTRVFSDQEEIPKIPAGVGVVAASDSTTYMLNETNIVLDDLHGSDTVKDVGLLFDDIMNEVYDRQSLLEAQADARMPEPEEGAVRHFQSQYLDLVDMHNGNAWVMASEDVDVYWGYPEGTDENTVFTLWHFAGLHRDGTDDPGESGYDLEDILAVEPEKVNIEKTPQGIRFTVPPGGFSPFVLIWEETDRPMDGGTDDSSPVSTGVYASPLFWSGVMSAAGAGVIAAVLRKRRNREVRKGED